MHYVFPSLNSKVSEQGIYFPKPEFKGHHRSDLLQRSRKHFDEQAGHIEEDNPALGLFRYMIQ